MVVAFRSRPLVWQRVQASPETAAWTLKSTDPGSPKPCSLPQVQDWINTFDCLVCQVYLSQLWMVTWTGAPAWS